MTGVMVVQRQALRAENIGHNLAQTGHSHDEGAAEDLRAVPQRSGDPSLLWHRSYSSTAVQHTMGAMDTIACILTGDPFVPRRDTS